MVEHDYIFNVTINAKVGAYFNEEEYQNFLEFGDKDLSREEFARCRAMENAPRHLTMQIADGGLGSDDIELGDIEYHEEWE